MNTESAKVKMISDLLNQLHLKCMDQLEFKFFSNLDEFNRQYQIASDFITQNIKNYEPYVSGCIPLSSFFDYMNSLENNKYFKSKSTNEQFINNQKIEYLFTDFSNSEYPKKSIGNIKIAQKSYYHSHENAANIEWVLDKFYDHYSSLSKILQSLLNQFKTALSYEDISPQDRIILNIMGITIPHVICSEKAVAVNLFRITSNLFIKLTISENMITERLEHIIVKDIKRLEVIDNELNVHFHGLHYPESIKLDDYSSALKLQNHLTMLRNKRNLDKNK